MRIKTIHIQHFRSIYDAILECDSLTALVGANGAGKSTFLRALDIFYNSSARIERSDYYADDPTEPISITVTYVDLSPSEQAALAKYYHSQQLIVEKRIKWENEKAKAAYYGQMLRHRLFEEQIRSKSTAAERRSVYNELRRQAQYSTLPAHTNDPALQEALQAWEESNPGQCELLSSENQFFGFNQAGAARLERFTRFLLVPAVRDAHADATDERGSLVNELIDMVIRKALVERPEVKTLQEEASAKLNEIQELTGNDLTGLNERINQTLHYFAPNTDVAMSWQAANLALPLPKVSVLLSEDGYPTATERTGHGVQRALIISLLQNLTMRPNGESGASPRAATAPLASEAEAETAELADTEAAPPVATDQPSLILAIEEPELFQHPTRQRHFARILHELALGQVRGVASTIQVIYCTHSPIFVDIDRFDQIRVIAKRLATLPNKPKHTGVRATSRPEIAGTGISQAKLAATLTMSVNEGFFADFVVLVEGEGDRALLQGVAKAMDLSLEAHGIAIVVVDGNGGLAKPLVIFSHLQIPTFPIWDNDSNKTVENDRQTSIKLNRELLALCSCPPEDWPSGVYDTCAIFNPKLEAVIENDVCAAGILWADIERQVYSITGDKSLKRHAVISHLVQKACEQGCTFPTVQAILTKICTRVGVVLPSVTVASKVSL